MLCIVWFRRFLSQGKEHGTRWAVTSSEEFDTTKGMWEKKKKMAGFLALPVYDVSQDDAL